MEYSLDRDGFEESKKGHFGLIGAEYFGRTDSGEYESKVIEYNYQVWVEAANRRANLGCGEPVIPPIITEFTLTPIVVSKKDIGDKIGIDDCISPDLKYKRISEW